jgi:hypothetical protein
MSAHLSLVGSDDHRCQLLAERIVTVGSAAYDLLIASDASGDLDWVMRLLTDREVSAADLYAATRGDERIGALTTAEMGRRYAPTEDALFNEDGLGAEDAEAV